MRGTWRTARAVRGAVEGVPTGAREQGAGVVPEWPAGDGQVARRERANQRRPSGLVWQGGPGGPGALQHLRPARGGAVGETTMHMYLHCPLHCAPLVRLLQAVGAWRVAHASDAFTGEPALVPSRLEALRWVERRGDAVALPAHSTACLPKSYQQALLKEGCMRED
jgi:hypothetical protein